MAPYADDDCNEKCTYGFGGGVRPKLSPNVVEKICDSRVGFLESNTVCNEVSTCSPLWCRKEKKIAYATTFEYGLNKNNLPLVGPQHPPPHVCNVLVMHREVSSAFRTEPTRRSTTGHSSPTPWIGGATVDITRTGFLSTHTIALSFLDACILYSKCP